MNILSKTFVTGALAILATAATLSISMADQAEARGRGHGHHFRHGHIHGSPCFVGPHRAPHCGWGHRGHRFGHRFGYRVGYVVGYNVPGNCGWERVTVKRWNPAHNLLVITRKKVWTCF